MRFRAFLLLIPLLLLLAAPLWWPLAAGFLRPRGGLQAGPVRGADTRQFAMSGVRFSQSRGGKPEWQIQAARLVTAGGRDTELHLEEVEALLHGKDGDKDQGKAKGKNPDSGRFHITSEKGVYDSEALVLTLIDDVLVRMGRGYELRTEELQYMEKAAKVETKEPVQLVGTDLTVRGRGMSYNLKNGSYSVGGRLEVVLR